MRTTLKPYTEVKAGDRVQITEGFGSKRKVTATVHTVEVLADRSVHLNLILDGSGLRWRRGSLQPETAKIHVIDPASETGDKRLKIVWAYSDASGQWSSQSDALPPVAAKELAKELQAEIDRGAGAGYRTTRFQAVKIQNEGDPMPKGSPTRQTVEGDRPRALRLGMWNSYEDLRGALIAAGYTLQHSHSPPPESGPVRLAQPYTAPSGARHRGTIYVGKDPIEEWGMPSKDSGGGRPQYTIVSDESRLGRWLASRAEAFRILEGPTWSKIRGARVVDRDGKTVERERVTYKRCSCGMGDQQDVATHAEWCEMRKGAGTGKATCPKCGKTGAASRLKKHIAECGGGSWSGVAGLFAVWPITNRRVPVSSVEDARVKWEEFRDSSGAGVSEIGNGLEVQNAKGEIIATISYNGRITPSYGGGRPTTPRDREVFHGRFQVSRVALGKNIPGHLGRGGIEWEVLDEYGGRGKPSRVVFVSRSEEEAIAEARRLNGGGEAGPVLPAPSLNPGWPAGWTAEDEEDYTIARAESGGRIASRAQVMANRKVARASLDDWDAWFASLPDGAQLQYNNGGTDLVATVKVGDAMQNVALIGEWRYDLDRYKANPNYPHKQPTRIGGRGTIVEHTSYRGADPRALPIRLVLVPGVSIEEAERIRKEHPDDWTRRLARGGSGGLAGKTTYWKGDLAVYTGKTETIAGKLFYEVELAEGPHKGDRKVTPDGPETDAPVSAGARAHGETYRGYVLKPDPAETGFFRLEREDGGLLQRRIPSIEDGKRVIDAMHGDGPAPRPGTRRGEQGSLFGPSLKSGDKDD